VLLAAGLCKEILGTKLLPQWRFQFQECRYM